MKGESGVHKVAILASLVLFVGIFPAYSQENGELYAASPKAAKSAPLEPWNLSLTFDFDYKARSADLLLEPATKTYKNGVDVQRAYFEQPAIVDLCIESGSALSGVYGFGVAAEIAVKPEWRGDYFPATNLPFTSGSYSLESNLFSRSVVYWKSPGIEIGFGRDKIDYNGILEGGLLPSSRIPWYDALKAKGTLGQFSLDWMVATIQAVKAWDGKDITPEAGYSFETGDPNFKPTTIVEALTRLSWNLGKVELGVTDHAMMSRLNNRFDLTDIFPLVSRHQAGVAQTNNSMVMDASWELLPKLRISAQMGLDDIDLNPLGISDTATPTIDAYVLGARWDGTTKLGLVSAYAEGGYTHWLWGNYDGSQADPSDVNYFARFIYRFPRYNGGSILLPLTSPYGPGAFWLKSHGSVALALFEPAKEDGSGKRRPALSLELGYSLLYLDLNTEANLIDTKVIKNTTTANATRSRSFVASLPTVLSYGPWSACVEPAFVWHDESTAFEIELGLACTIVAGRR
jgi:hypothetical protein